MASGGDISWHNSRVRHFRRKDVGLQEEEGNTVHDAEKGSGQGENGADQMRDQNGRIVNHAGHVVSKGIKPDGESGRNWFHPWHFIRICFRSSCTASKWTNLLWPFTIAALILRYGFKELDLWIFITAYIGMIPAANLLGFAGQELARKIPPVVGLLLETTLGSVVEIVLFMILLVKGQDSSSSSAHSHANVIRAAILGSILANLLFCLGLCFFVGGIFRPQQTFHGAISEVGSNLTLVAAVGLVIPTIFQRALADFPQASSEMVGSAVLRISRATAIILLVAFVLYLWFQGRSHHGLYADILEYDESRDHDRERDLKKAKLTFTEAILAIAIALTFVTLSAIFLVEKIDFMVNERQISDAFMGLILVPIVEKAAEHITAVDEAYDNQMNFALAHVLGASIQTALLNTPLVILVGWGIGDDTMSLDFEIFDAIVLILAIIVVGNFLRDEKSDYLEGALCVFVWVLIAICAFYYPNRPTNDAEGSSAESTSGSSTSETAASVTEAIARMVLRTPV